jgi:hypothetical protein
MKRGRESEMKRGRERLGEFVRRLDTVAVFATLCNNRFTKLPLSNDVSPSHMVYEAYKNQSNTSVRIPGAFSPALLRVASSQRLLRSEKGS